MNHVPLTLSLTELLQRLADGATLTRETRWEWWLATNGMEQHLSHGAPAQLMVMDYIALNAERTAWQLTASGRSALARLKTMEEKP